MTAIDIVDSGAISAQAETLLKQMFADGWVIPSPENIQQYRKELRIGYQANIDNAIAQFKGDITEVYIDGVNCLQITPSGWGKKNRRCIQYAYGGGYVSGSTQEDLTITTALASKSASRVVSVNYRLAPEHPFPAPQDDFAQVYPALLDKYGSKRLAVSGESAGGNQALALLHRAGRERWPMPACALLFSPWIDLIQSGDSHVSNEGRDPTLDNAGARAMAAMFANGHPREDPLISPLFGSMEGLPPIMITAGSRDNLMSDSLRLSRKLHNAGVECDLRLWEGLWHVFEFYPIPEAKISIAEAGAFIKKHCR
ncbi:MAG: monoterpene epsilon-lactone hydrolase [Gammaproteobacteria bacterium]|jgi:monoterpene epsilon-lactone hydrolase